MCWGFINFGIPWDGSGEIQASRCFHTPGGDERLHPGWGTSTQDISILQGQNLQILMLTQWKGCVLHWHGTLEMSDRKFSSEVSYHQWYVWDGENPQGEFNKDCYPKHSHGMTKKTWWVLWFLDDPFFQPEIFSGVHLILLVAGHMYPFSKTGTPSAKKLWNQEVRDQINAEIRRFQEKVPVFWMVDLIVRQPLHSREFGFLSSHQFERRSRKEWWKPCFFFDSWPQIFHMFWLCIESWHMLPQPMIAFACTFFTVGGYSPSVDFTQFCWWVRQKISTRLPVVEVNRL